MVIEQDFVWCHKMNERSSLDRFLSNLENGYYKSKCIKIMYITMLCVEMEIISSHLCHTDTVKSILYGIVH